MTDRELPLRSRLLLGAIAGAVGTLAMTAAMRRLHRRLPEQERYPLTPREIIDSAARQLDAELTDEGAKDVTTLGHFAFGAAAGGVIAGANPRIGLVEGAIAGSAVWLGSYMGWIPAMRLLKPANRHPPRRNLLMIGVHLVWGATTAAALRELVLARSSIIATGEDRDMPGEGD